ncbi:exonuclease sbcCD subunit D [Aliidiomarina minuta]|uniref:Nuclease SbcCD subunit D n=1 Tax=Aliidiomarina minuta TaxID=880057 RepID=A0A432W1B0_9GAMM|nr:exonuclease SbcCD subunit D C-terminal domain-containing protein [Aliidiomarina minuta]RUO22978.1 exonuclease sbcCD subunit D [Aliidiomarina minuta]
MKLLHTSDWHLGRTLYGKKRHAEFAAFLSWLEQMLTEQEIDILLVAGDVFDTNTPGNRAQELYYQFLSRIALGPCRHVIIIGGNHDSPSFLDAPQHLLRSLNVHVIGAACDDPADEVITLKNKQGQPEAIICAVPYLRDRDLRISAVGESIEEKEQKLLQGIREHYAATGAHALECRGDSDVPIIGMGHLFTVDGKVEEGDGVRDLYVGSLGKVPASIFPDCYDYLALGHLHVPQRVAGKENMRFSGSPIAMGFGEAYQQKSLCLVEFDGCQCKVELLPIPLFQRLERVKGDLSNVSASLKKLAEAGQSVWVEVDYQGDASVSQLRERLQADIEDSQVEILRVRNAKARNKALRRDTAEETLDEMNVHEVFQRRLAASEVEEPQQLKLKDMYHQVVKAVQEADTREDS